MSGPVPKAPGSHARNAQFAKKLKRYPVNGRMRSLSEIAVALEAAGHVTRVGTRYAPAAIARMVGA